MCSLSLFGVPKMGRAPCQGTARVLQTSTSVCPREDAIGRVEHGASASVLLHPAGMADGSPMEWMLGNSPVCQLGARGPAPERKRTPS